MDIMAAKIDHLFTIYVDIEEASNQIPHSLVMHLVNHLFGDNVIVARWVYNASYPICYYIVTSRDHCTAVRLQFNAGAPQFHQISSLHLNLAMSSILDLI
ncbi:hypothetical protein RF11_04994 [Thelohanellus kitauei]|uniref:Reverse transcriptase domain-containing protein n=1 Tax=Thelohanellus kitauei TaxID=669202 RepID=A0A0C2MCF1_THEKT|nr:hypothetical protein RF11_04994 [Thelohanellus kitauei]